MTNNERTISVTQLNEYVKALIDSDELLQTVAVSGEISNFKNHYATGHLYFSLKDEKSLVKCVMFSRDASRLRFEPDNGTLVTVWGRVSVFPRDGAYQLYVGYMSPSGIGEQYTNFEMLKSKLLSEGLFDTSKKKPIPRFPKRIGVITSPTGAAVRDIMNILGRRWPIAETELYPALVQGTGAASSLIAGVKYFVGNNSVDVIILGRGGGSGEDLSAFNDEGLARAIAQSHIPVISAVGHETDVSISDFVADLRAPTPSAAAELAVPDMNEYLATMELLISRARGCLAKQIEHYESKLNDLSSSPVLARPERYIESREYDLHFYYNRLQYSYRMILTESDASFSRLVSRLDDLNPLSVLSRGYSIVKRDDSVIRSSSQLNKGDSVDILFTDGSVKAVIE